MKFIIAMLLLVSFGMIVMVRTSGSKDEHERYSAWKEKKKHERHDI